MMEEMDNDKKMMRKRKEKEIRRNKEEEEKVSKTPITKKKEIEKKERIGWGGYGEVWLCKWRSIDVAVKYIHYKNKNKKEKETFLHEANMMNNLRSPYTITLFSICV